MEQKDTSIENKKLDTLFLSVAQSLGGESPLYIWPAPYSTPAECEFYLSNEFLKSFYSDTIQLQEKGYKLKDIAEILKNPSKITQTLWPFGHVVNVDEQFKKELINLASIIVELLSYYREDPFNQNGKNTIWSQNQVSDFITSNKMINVNDNLFEKYRMLISRLEGTLWLYSELLYFSIHEVCKEFHGPYSLQDKRLVLVREYYNLKPEFWNFTKNISYNNILSFEIYKPNTDITIDFFGRLRSNQPIIRNLDSFSIFVDGNPMIDYEDINRIYTNTVEITNNGVKVVSDLSRLQIMQKLVESYYYILKPLKDKLNNKWEPPEIIMDDIKNERKKEVVEHLYANFKELANIPPSEIISIISKIFDPRFQ